ELHRAFIAYAGTDLKRGAVITKVSATTYVGDEARDIAPGGILVPASQGMAEVPMGASSQVIDSYPLVGPTRYASARIERTPTGLTVNVTSLLKQGDQHIHLRGTGLRLAEDAPFELKANGTRQVGVEILGPGELIVSTDIGGRSTIRIAETEEGLTVLHDDGSTLVLASEDSSQDAPGLPFLGALAALGAVLALRRGRLA
ncbi:MAG: hypothetical protein QOJ26_1399, partial [Thermoplasmata archaeon]|nr:hypothetical protein [Thermoplasmata archaeon]